MIHLPGTGQCMQDYIASIQALCRLFLALIGSLMKKTLLIVQVVQAKIVIIHSSSSNTVVHEIFVFGQN